MLVRDFTGIKTPLSLRKFNMSKSLKSAIIAVIIVAIAVGYIFLISIFPIIGKVTFILFLWLLTWIFVYAVEDN